MKVITLCGSTKFREKFDYINRILTLQGNVVISCGVWKHEMNREFQEKEIALLEKIHFKKIDLASQIFVINLNGYVGEHTQLEIEYAKELGKQIIYLEHDFEGDWILTCKRCEYSVAMRDEKADPYCMTKLESR